MIILFEFDPPLRIKVYGGEWLSLEKRSIWLFNRLQYFFPSQFFLSREIFRIPRGFACSFDFFSPIIFCLERR
jgi:hypothetical protein